MGLFDTVMDTVASGVDTGLEFCETEAGPIGAGMASMVHGAESAYYTVTGDDKKATEQEVEAVGSMVGAVPGIGLADVTVGSALSDDGPKSLTEMGAEKLGDAMYGEDYKPHETSTAEKVGGTLGALVGTATGQGLEVASLAQTGRSIGGWVGGLFD